MDYKEKISKIDYELYQESDDKLKSQLYGYFTTLILSKVYAPMNSDLEDIMKKFNIKFLPYVYKSRTILLSRVIRIIEKKSNQDLSTMLDSLKEYLDSADIKEDSLKKDTKKTDKKKRKKKNIFDDIFNQLG
ncbi:hypothetical protein [Lactococcus cremoris]|uniref:hypothetical protein n=1 Tax=Lactococcus lactis subsp. cremoris TaxID=1359 RepID=UPI0019652C80|nr:hypothetical protein [Lactococcus cremoris]QRZ33086.1 hypothetical protein LLW34_1959 [Lactococcus cremoris]